MGEGEDRVFVSPRQSSESGYEFCNFGFHLRFDGLGVIYLRRVVIGPPVVWDESSVTLVGSSSGAGTDRSGSTSLSTSNHSAICSSETGSFGIRLRLAIPARSTALRVAPSMTLSFSASPSNSRIGSHYAPGTSRRISLIGNRSAFLAFSTVIASGR
jgi:hypothetical protein